MPVVDKTLIKFNVSDEKTYKAYVDDLNDFITGEKFRKNFFPVIFSTFFSFQNNFFIMQSIEKNFILFSQ